MNYIGSHYLNVISKVALVLGASSQTGAAICRSLLNSNAFVLGIDTEKAHPSTRSARGSHFQFFKTDEDVDWDEGMRYSYQMFWRDEVDFVVLVVGKHDDEKGGAIEVEALKKVVEKMEDRGEGLVLVVSGSEVGTSDMVIQKAKEIRRILTNKGVRCNAILLAGSFPTKGGISSLDDMQDHIAEHTLKRKEGGYQIEYAREVANVALFLCTELGKGIDGMIVGSDGSCGTLAE